MWADPVLLRIGERHDVLVAVQPDTPAAADRLGELLGPWTEPRFDDATLTARPAFRVVLDPPGPSADGPTPGPRLVPQLRYGSAVMARSRRPDDVVAALAEVLGGIHHLRRDDGRLWADLRVFARGDAAVLVDVGRPTLVNDPQLAGDGIDELATWSVAVERDHAVLLPPPLGEGTRHDSGWRRLRLAGIVTMSNRGSTRDELERHSHQSVWSELVASLRAGGRIVGGDDPASLRTGIRRLLDEHPT